MRRVRLSHLIFSALMGAILCLLAPLSLPVGGFPVSLGLFGVGLAARLCPRGYGLWSVALYLGLGAVGLPVFAGFSGGVGVFAGPTGGFLIGYLTLAALMCGVGSTTVLRRALGDMAGLAACYLLGFAWFWFATGAALPTVLVTLLPLVPIDLLKLTAAELLSMGVRRRVKG